jgi:hypothetical protein
MSSSDYRGRAVQPLDLVKIPELNNESTITHIIQLSGGQMSASHDCHGIICDPKAIYADMNQQQVG